MACKAMVLTATYRLSSYFLLAAAILIGQAAAALAASSMSVSLTGFTGDSTQPATQTAVGAAGLNFYSTAGLDDEFTSDPTVAFSGTGASFGSLFGGDGGRNYMRTNDSDYATVSFTAEITIERTSNGQDAFIGMGAGDTALFGVPDWSTLFSSTFTTPQEGSLTTWRSSNDANVWTDGPDVPVVGAHRLRMEFDAVARTMTYSLDFDYTGGPFVAQATTNPVDLNHVDCPTGCGDPEMPISADFFGPDGWPNEPSRIYFGGDDGTIFRDFTVTVSAPPVLLGDYNGNNVIDAADYTVWRNLFGTAGPLPNDATPESVDTDDYDYWKSHFGETLGGGSVASAAVPEPGTLLVSLLGVVGVGIVRGRRKTQ